MHGALLLHIVGRQVPLKRDHHLRRTTHNFWSNSLRKLKVIRPSITSSWSLLVKKNVFACFKLDEYHMQKRIWMG